MDFFIYAHSFMQIIVFLYYYLCKMEELLEISNKTVSETPDGFVRYLFSEINWSSQLIGIKGARGTGKTTLLLQYLKQSKVNKKAYFSLDELYFSNNTLLETVSTFYKNGGKLVVLDEVHKYENWSREIKNLHDRYKDLQIVFTGSSIIDINKQEADLSRRAVMYELQGLSFREFLQWEHHINLPVFSLTDLLDKDEIYSFILNDNFKPLAYFNEYLKFGYYPFYKEDTQSYYQKLRQVVRNIVEYDMAEIQGFDIRQAKKMLKLLYIIAQQVPFKPNLKSLAEKTNLHRNSLNNYIYYLSQAKLLLLLEQHNFSIASLQKPDKIYLENTNLMFALSEEQPNKGTLRETYFFNQVKGKHQVNFSKACDFLIDNKWSFEIGGKHKKNKQIKHIENAFVVKDNLEIKAGNSIPLWIFGLLY